MAVQNGTVFSPAGNYNAVFDVSAGGGALGTFLSFSGLDPESVVTDANNLYVTGFSAGVFQVPLAGGPPLTIFSDTSGSAEIVYLAVDSANVYFTDNGTLERADRRRCGHDAGDRPVLRWHRRRRRGGLLDRSRIEPGLGHGDEGREIAGEHRRPSSARQLHHRYTTKRRVTFSPGRARARQLP